MRAAPQPASVSAPRQGFEDTDSYDAAMRAADALFARAPSKPRMDERPRPAVSDDQPSDPRNTTAQATPSEPGAAVDDAALSAPERAGRILRVIDEPEADPFAQMEAERAPKKRGRKPGSKNKPKPALTVVAALEVEPQGEWEADSASGPQMAAVEPAFAGASMPSALAPFRPVVGRRASPSRDTYKADKAERFSWVRTRLGPGEQWKRRLPKVIW